MNIPQDDLNALARAFVRIHRANADAAQRLRAGDVVGAQTAIEEGRGLAWRSMQAAVRAGADAPPEVPSVPQTPLALLDTPANRKLLYALRSATDAAIERDKETGDYPDGFAEVLEHFTAGITDEVEGPVHAGRE